MTDKSAPKPIVADADVERVKREIEADKARVAKTKTRAVRIPMVHFANSN